MHEYEDDFELAVLELLTQNEWDYTCGYDLHREKDDIVITLGAGTVTQIGPMLVD